MSSDTASAHSRVRLKSWFLFHPWGTGVIIILVLLSVWDHATYSGWLGRDHERYHNRVFLCVNVVDGDTIDIDITDDTYSEHTCAIVGRGYAGSRQERPGRDVLRA